MTTLLPLVVDLDGTLITTDLLVEGVFTALGENPWRLGAMIKALSKGKAALKACVAAAAPLDPATLPYRPEILALIDAARAEGRPVYLASASPEPYVKAIAEHLGLFEGWFATTDARNLAGRAKAEALVERFGQGGFDYVGNDTPDLAIWAVCHRRFAVAAPARVAQRLKALDPQAQFLATPSFSLKSWLKLLRVHQWTKNALVFVALVTSQSYTLSAFEAACGAFMAFSLAASSIYILNDLVDCRADRLHPSKKRRPLASGALSPLTALAVSPLLMGFAAYAALATSLRLALVLAGYVALTTAYSFWLKRKMVVDVVTLALLYTLRVIGGAVAIAVAPSEWLLAFSLFVFTALALIKRYVELLVRFDKDLPDPDNRDYRKTDLSVIAALAAAAGFNAVTVFALYISSSTVRELYPHHEILWLICPVLLYWLSRVLMLAHRRQLHDDPIVFALRDRNSLLTFALIVAILVGGKIAW